MIAIAVVPAVIALLVRSRRESEREVREQERRRYAYENGSGIARDVHDVVGHSLAVITMQAGVALHLLDKERTAHPRPDQVASSLEAIKKTSREALAELRTTLGGLSSGRRGAAESIAWIGSTRRPESMGCAPLAGM